MKLVFAGDTGEGNTSAKKIGDQMGIKCQAQGGCTAAILLGDNFYDDGVTSVNDPLWKTHFEDIYSHAGLDGLKFYTILGNHDYGLTSTGNAQAQIDYSNLPVGSGPGMRASDKWIMPAKWYDVRFGPVHIFALDTQDNLGPQGNEMAAKVAASNAPWKFTMGHHMRYTDGKHNYDNWLIPGLLDMLPVVYCGTQLYICGHDHNTQMADRGKDGACPNTYFVVSGAGSKTTDFVNVPLPMYAMSPRLFGNDSIPAFTYIHVEPTQAMLQFIDEDGNVLFSHAMQRN